MHFAGIGGAGMSALAQFHVQGGGRATGSDRLLDRGELGRLRDKLEALGIKLYPQDGSGIGKDTVEMIVSTAIEDSVPDILQARKMKIPVTHRSDALARYVVEHKAIAVAGTSGKSTVTAMIYEILAAAKKRPSVISGAPINSLKQRGHIGNAFHGGSNLLVIEADESDGSLPKYAPWMGVLLNLSKDHKEVAELREIFLTFQARCDRFLINADCENLAGFKSTSRSFGFDNGTLRGESLKVGKDGSSFLVQETAFDIPVPGRYNAENALAAAAACLEAGVGLEISAQALKEFKGIERRFEHVGTAAGVEVVDDFAHNPDKVRAVFEAAHARAGRVLAVYQLHGYSPTRFLRDEFIAAFSAAMRPADVLWLPDIYYAGGTAKKNIGPDDIAAPVRQAGRDARTAGDREAVIGEIVSEARRGDLVLVLGARDPSLSEFAGRIFQALAVKDSQKAST